MMDKEIEILHRMGCQDPVSITAFSHEDGEGEYDVWNVGFSDRQAVLKRAETHELSNYLTYLQETAYAPKLLSHQDNYLLLEYIDGQNLMKCNRDMLRSAIDSMAAMQETHWDAPKSSQSLESRENRRAYLRSDLLERAYDAYLQDCRQIPWTLCHDDLLPFNVIATDDRAVFIDWEHAGILPYPASLARLLAHGEEDSNALFYLSASDREFAIQYYYEKLLQHRGVTKAMYYRSLALHLFYEYCEWVYVGNKFGDTDGDLFKKYSILATNIAKKLGF